MVIYIPLNVSDGMKFCTFQASFLSLERIRMSNLMNCGGGECIDIRNPILWKKNVPNEYDMCRCIVMQYELVFVFMKV